MSGTTTEIEPRYPLERVHPVESVEDVLDRLDEIIAWSIDVGSAIGYFAVLYKRATLAIKNALDNGEFQDCARMEIFDINFAQRYFDALNAYFHPDEYSGLTPPWEVAFLGHEYDKPVVLQQMLTGLNAHINLDLGMAAFATAEKELPGLEQDFNLINALIASQVTGVLDVLVDISPGLRWLRLLIPFEVELIKKTLKDFRHAAWLFAIALAIAPEADRRRLQVVHSSWFSALGSWYLYPPDTCQLFPLLIRAISAQERRDIAANVRALDVVSHDCAPLNTAFL